MSILHGHIYAGFNVGLIPAVFSDKVVSLTEDNYPMEYTIGAITFAKDEESKEIVFSPYKSTTLYIVEDDETVIILNIEECIKKFNISIFSFLDLYVSKNKEELTRLVDQAIMSREYSITVQ